MLKKLEKLSIKNKIKKSPSLEFFCFNFYDNLKPNDALSFWPPTAPKSQLPLRFYRLLPLKGGARARKLDEYFRKVKGSKPEKREGDYNELEHEALRVFLKFLGYKTHKSGEKFKVRGLHSLKLYKNTHNANGF